MAADHQTDLIEQLSGDHRSLRVMFSELAGLPIGDPQRKYLADRAGVELVRHLEAEEAHLYPLARRTLPRGDGTVDNGLAVHTSLQALVREIGVWQADSPRFDRLIAQLVEAATGHFGTEEAMIFSAVSAGVPDEALNTLGDEARETEEKASGRPPRQPATALPPDDLPSPERSFGERVRDFFRSGPSH